MKKLLEIVPLITLIIFTIFLLSKSNFGSNRGEYNIEHLIVAMGEEDYFPFKYYDKKLKKNVGFDIDFAMDLGEELKKKVLIKNMPFADIINAVHKRKAHIAISAISPDKNRSKLVDFSDIYYSSPFYLIFKRSNKMFTLEDLNNKKLGVEIGTSMESYVRNYVKNYKILINIIPYSSSYKAIKDLNNNNIDAFITEEFPALKEAINSDKNLAIQKIPQSSGGYAIAMQHDWILSHDINIAISNLMKNGKMKRLYSRYGLLSLTD
ncbi:ABC transporter substrate-binding protein [Lyticum sinuosum]|uniref:ABC transporter substrate-binding protein n=1 Tax=Lyticum sinuosum TaxID=1332059 RepID=A0AAE4VL16_9RICK|nr:ABC transporter substrate-binding protein [Lyticum sinuosum]MDZ5761047.1 ABC transporter substrate-binding protein [Lyticum sinuosum]